MINIVNVKKYCCEDPSLIENYDKAMRDTKQTWHLHHRLEIQKNKVLSRADLKRAGLYYKRPASELIFHTPRIHKVIHIKHNPYRFVIYKDTINKLNTIGTKKKRIISEAPKKERIISEETKKKISEATSKKFKWLTPTGEIMIMNKCCARMWHKDWTLIGESQQMTAFKLFVTSAIK